MYLSIILGVIGSKAQYERLVQRCLLKTEKRGLTMDENIKENQTAQQDSEELELKNAIAAAKEEKAKLIAKNMAACSFEDEVIQDNGRQVVVDSALKKATDAVNAVKSGRDNAGVRSTASLPAQRGGRENMQNGEKGSGAKEHKRPSQSSVNGQRRRNDQATRPHRSGKAPVRKKKKSKAPIIVCVSLLVAVVLIVGITYIVGMMKYKGVFLDNTFINNIEVSGKTKKEAYDLVKAQSELKDSITIVRLDGSNISLALEEIGYSDKTQYEIEKFYNSQNHYNWFGAKFNNTQFEFSEKFTYDKVMLETLLKKKVTAVSSGKAPENATIQKSTDGSGYVIIKEKPGDKVNTDKIQNLYDYVEQSLDAGRYIIDISGVDCYETAKVTADSLKQECEKLNKMNSLEITFDFVHSQEVLKGGQIMDWISYDSKSKDGIVLDMKQVEKYVETLAEKYDTYGKDRQFKTTNSGTITIKGGDMMANDTGCYGWWIDQQKTMQLIKDTIIAGKNATIKPVYYENPDSHFVYACDESVWQKDKDYGDTYIEIDLSKQHLWFYKQGKLVLECDIVSGYLYDQNRYTREGVYKVWLKQSPSRLKGEGWDVNVTYWINISLYGAGLHDASWQYGVFGGNKYKTPGGGSHGCINMSLETAKKIYETADYNTPVFIYSSEKIAAAKPAA